MKTYKSLLICVCLLLLRCLSSAAQCDEVEAVLKDIVTKGLSPKVVSQSFDPSKRIACYNIEGLDEDDFILLGRGLQYSNIISNSPNTVEYNVLRMVDIYNGKACEYIFIQENKIRKPNENKYINFNKQKISNLIKAKEENLALLKKQQAYLTTDLLNILGDVLVGEIKATEPFLSIVSDAAKKLKTRGINHVSKYYDLEYEPSENKTADIVRNIISPIDNFLGLSGIPTGKWLKYWEALKLTPDGGMVIGNVAAKVRIFFLEKDLKDEIIMLEKRMNRVHSM